MEEAKNIIDKLQLLPHPEGGFYRETYRSEMKITTENGPLRNVSTAIFYLLEGADRSHFHRIKSDELWFFHAGQTLEILVLNDHKLERILLGNKLEAGELPQACIPANSWFASHVKDESGFSLVSCTVAPGFDFADFEMAERAELLKEFPNFKETVERFTR